MTRRESQTPDRSALTDQAFKDCLRLRELAGRQTLKLGDNRDLDAIADRLHGLAVSLIDTQYVKAKRRCDVKGCTDEGTVAVREVAMPWIGTYVCERHASSWPFKGDFYERGERVERGE